MGTYNIPRNLRGETRILIIFSVKSLITTGIGLLVGLIFFFIFSLVNIKIAGIIIMAICALIGYVIGAVKIPTLNRNTIYQKDRWRVIRRNYKKIY